MLECNNCLNDNKEICDNIRTFKDCEYLIRPQLHYFCEKAGSIQDEDEGLFYDEFVELDEIEYFEKDASQLITKGDIAVMKTDDDRLYYLLKLTKDPYETKDTVWL